MVAIDFRPIFYVIGIMLVTIAITMVFPLLVDYFNDNDDWHIFLISMAVTGFVGVSMLLSNQGGTYSLNVRQGFLLTSSSWLVLAAFGSLPFMLSDLSLSFTDAYFETMSAITTTGSTVMTGLDEVAPGILLWRSILQWIGGIGIIVTAISMLPFLRVGGMQLFTTESSENEKVLPRAAQIVTTIGILYLFFSFLCMIGYGLAGMSLFDAICHAMTTLSTGGFSTSDASMGQFDNPKIEMVAIVFMIVGGMPMALFLKVVHGRPSALLEDSQVRWYLSVLGLAVLGMLTYLVFVQSYMPLDALRKAAFNVVSVITGTGYATTNYEYWGTFAVVALYFFMFVGGCAGSASCGIKIFRFQVLYEVARIQMLRLIHPHGVFTPYYNGRPMPSDVPLAVMSFFFVFALSYCILTILVALTGVDVITAITATATTFSNVGPGFGDMVGPSGTFTNMPMMAKWVLALAMLLGRLELFTFLVLFTPAFWRR